MSGRDPSTGANLPLRPVPAHRDGFALVCGTMAGLFALLILVLLSADAWYLIGHGVGPAEAWRSVSTPAIRRAVVMSLATSACSLLLSLLFGVPVAYVLSRWRFPGRALLNTLVDVPVVVPPVAIGVSLLAFFGTGPGRAIRQALAAVELSLVSGLGIVLCQFVMAVPYCIRAVKASFDAVDQELEDVALVLGCSRWRLFRGVTLPLARTGLLAGGVMAWARALGVFAPIMAFVGTGPRVQIMPTCIWLELSIGNVEASLTLALGMLGLSGAALVAVHALVPGRPWT